MGWSTCTPTIARTYAPPPSRLASIRFVTAWRGLRNAWRLPWGYVRALLHSALAMAILYLALQLLCAVPKVDGMPSPRVVTRARSAVRAVHPAAAVRLDAALLEGFDVTYLEGAVVGEGGGSLSTPSKKFLSHTDAMGLATAMGCAAAAAPCDIPCAIAALPDELTLADTGAGKAVVTSEKYAVPNTKRCNSTAVASANGVVTPQWCCDIRIPMTMDTPDGDRKTTR